jgi:hypothetical protein
MQVTATMNGWEIGYGEGESYIYAIEECMSSIESIYLEEGVIGDIQLILNDSGNTTLPKYVMLTDYYYKQREYF